jgi:hypothetical protein
MNQNVDTVVLFMEILGQLEKKIQLTVKQDEVLLKSSCS